MRTVAKVTSCDECWRLLSILVTHANFSIRPPSYVSTFAEQAAIDG
jgi:hypothetical protein